MLHIWVKAMGKGKPLSPQSDTLFTLVSPLPVMDGETVWFTSLPFVIVWRSVQQNRLHFCGCSCVGPLMTLLYSHAGDQRVEENTGCASNQWSSSRAGI